LSTRAVGVILHRRPTNRKKDGLPVVSERPPVMGHSGWLRSQSRSERDGSSKEPRRQPSSIRRLRRHKKTERAPIGTRVLRAAKTGCAPTRRMPSSATSIKGGQPCEHRAEKIPALLAGEDRRLLRGKPAWWRTTLVFARPGRRVHSSIRGGPEIAWRGDIFSGEHWIAFKVAPPHAYQARVVRNLGRRASAWGRRASSSLTELRVGRLLRVELADRSALARPAQRPVFLAC